MKRSVTLAGNAICATRKEFQLSRATLAKLSGIPRFTISNAEHGDHKLTPEEQQKLRDALATEIKRIGKLNLPGALKK